MKRDHVSDVRAEVVPPKGEVIMRCKSRRSRSTVGMGEHTGSGRSPEHHAGMEMQAGAGSVLPYAAHSATMGTGQV